MWVLQTHNPNVSCKSLPQTTCGSSVTSHKLPVGRKSSTEVTPLYAPPSGVECNVDDDEVPMSLNVGKDLLG